MTLFDRVQTLCKIKKVTQKKLLQDLDLAPNTLTRWKDGMNPSSEVLLKVSTYLGVSMEYLLTGNEPTTNNKLIELAKQIDSLPVDYQNIVINLINQLSSLNDR